MNSEDKEFFTTISGSHLTMLLHAWDLLVLRSYTRSHNFIINISSSIATNYWVDFISKIPSQRLDLWALDFIIQMDVVIFERIFLLY